jgi:hypothetical protein
LIDIIVTDDIGVILLLPDEFTIDDLVTLVADEVVERLDDGVKVDALGNGVDPVLAFGTSVIVVGTLEDEAHALGHKTDVASFAPAEKIEGNLSKSVIVAHVVHGISPAVEGGVEGFCATFHTLQTLETGVLRLTNSIIKIELGREVPLAVVGMLTANIIGMEGEEGLIWAHTGGAGVEELHGEVELRGTVRERGNTIMGSHTMLRMESRWKPNFWAKSRKMSSISSVDIGIWRSADQAG